MSPYHLIHLDRDAYIASVATIQDPKTVKFANMSLAWWDDHHLWYKQGCVVLCDAQQNHLCYVFYRTDQYREYMHIHNIFTPSVLRRNGYAFALLDMIFVLADEHHIKRFKLTTISSSLDFYLALGLVYWGVNSVGDYYCDLPLPSGGISRLDAMVKSSDKATLIGKKLDSVYAKVQGNADSLSAAQTIIYDSDLLKMGENYMLETLLAMKAA